MGTGGVPFDMSDQNEPGGKGSAAKRVNHFLNGKGFYIVLFLCVAAIGISGYVIFFANNAAAPPEGPGIPDWGLNFSSGTTYGFLPTTPPESREVQGTVPDIPAGTTAPPPDTTLRPPAKTEAPQKIFYVRPVAGTVLREYSGTTPVFNPTMADWRVHAGIDITADAGEPVLSVAAGTVADVYDDDFAGVTVVIDHGGGVQSVYSGLGRQFSVSAGDSVSAGTIIGAVGTTARFESLDPPHLHFEMLKDGEYVNPNEYIPMS